MSIIKVDYGTISGATQTWSGYGTYGTAINCGFEPKKLVYAVYDTGAGIVFFVYENNTLLQYYSGNSHDVTAYISSYLTFSSTGVTILQGSGAWTGNPVVFAEG